MSIDSGKTGSRGEAPPAGVSRRGFLQAVGLTAGLLAAPFGEGRAAADPGLPSIGPGAAKFALKINGQAREVEAEPRLTLLDVLRDKLDMTGSKRVCDRGSCGACTVMVNGESVCSCMMLAADAVGKEITTVEGLAKADGTLDPIQEAFIEHDAQQCGFCTPGFVVRARALLNENPKPSMDEVRNGMSGNICRCGTYTHVFAAILAASKKEA